MWILVLGVFRKQNSLNSCHWEIEQTFGVKKEFWWVFWCSPHFYTMAHVLYVSCMWMIEWVRIYFLNSWTTDEICLKCYVSIYWNYGNIEFGFCRFALTRDIHLLLVFRFRGRTTWMPHMRWNIWWIRMIDCAFVWRVGKYVNMQWKCLTWWCVLLCLWVW